MSFRSAYRLNEQQFAVLSGRPIDKLGLSGARAALTLISLGALLIEAAFVVVALWLIVSVRTFALDIIAVVLLLVAFALRPRFGRLSKYAEPVDPADLPALQRLITTVATEIGAPAPDVLLFDSGFNASTGTYGLRRRKYLRIGLPLWLSLKPQEQVALIAHELGHFVNGDVRRGPLTQYAFSFLGNLAVMTKPDSGQSRYTRGGRGRGASMAVLGDLLTRPIMAMISFVFGLLQLFIEWLGVRASHHAEYAADAMAARVAGGVETAGLIDALMLREACITVLRRASYAGAAPDSWRQALLDGRGEVAPRIQRLRQLSMRDEASLARSHPPHGLRARLVESRATGTARFVLTAFESAQIDAELARSYRTLRTELANMT